MKIPLLLLLINTPKVAFIRREGFLESRYPFIDFRIGADYQSIAHNNPDELLAAW